MIQGRGGTGFAPEAFEGLTVMGHIIRQEFQRDVTAKVFVLGFIYHAHPAATELFQNPIVGNPSAGEGGRVGHWRAILRRAPKQVKVGVPRTKTLKTGLELLIFSAKP